MDRAKLIQARKWIRYQLSSCADFWLDYGMDKVHGGVYTCLDRTGKIYSTDKSVWMQGRCGWMYAWLCKNYGKRQQWLDASRSCLDFMESYCINRQAGDRMYFTVTEDGKPLRQRRYSASEGFYAMANAEYYGQTGDPVYLERARKAYELCWDLAHGMEDPTGLGPKTIVETRSGHAFGSPMGFLNINSVFLRVDPERRELYESRAKECVEEIFRYQVHPELKCVLENTGPKGEARLGFSEGRIIKPGHDMEGVWFLLEHARRFAEPGLTEKAEEIYSWAYDRGWDPQYGGLLYIVDALGMPPEAYEHDMKVWWPHAELLTAEIMLYRDTRKEIYLDRFYEALSYVQSHMADGEYGEWYGYLRRDGKPTEPPLKGSTFKGPYHVLRMLVNTDQAMGEILDAE